MSLKDLQVIAAKSPSIKIVHELILEEIEEVLGKLKRLRLLQDELVSAFSYQYFPNDPDIDVQSDKFKSIQDKRILDVKRMQDPIQAFIVLNRVWQIVTELDDYFRWEEKRRHAISAIRWKDMKKSKKLPTGMHYEKLGKTVLRLQQFSGASVEEVEAGDAPKPSKKAKKDPQLEPLRMTYRECFELGKTAYDNENNVVALKWFQRALALIEEVTTKSRAKKPDVIMGYQLTNILDHAAYAAYRNKNYKFAIQLTEKWLEYDPVSERAKDNLAYFKNELRKVESSIKENEEISGSLKLIGETLSKTSIDSIKEHIIPEYEFQWGIPFDPDEYEITSDAVVKRLCSYRAIDITNLTCSSRLALVDDIPGSKLKIERLFPDPEVLRIHNIITKQEAAHLRASADPKLQSSTVQLKKETVVSEFRVAQTAWLSKKLDPVVQRIEDRIGKLLNIDLSESEDLQVVNYGVGGYYGPHLDTARKPESESSSATQDEGQLMRSDRLATILIYLNEVESGGATVFPRLNLTVQPIPYSAIVWFNLKKNGFADAMTVHSGCPVLAGSKWIATKWPRDKPNAFIRPCGSGPSE